VAAEAIRRALSGEPRALDSTKTLELLDAFATAVTLFFPAALAWVRDDLSFP
jgi:hypothetical protein